MQMILFMLKCVNCFKNRGLFVLLLEPICRNFEASLMSLWGFGFYIPVLAVVFGVVNMPNERRLRRCTTSASVGPSFWPESGQCLRSHWRTHQRVSHTKPEIKKIAKYWEKVPNLNLDLEICMYEETSKIKFHSFTWFDNQFRNYEYRSFTIVFLTNRVVFNYKNQNKLDFFTKSW